ncbi:MAG: tRNA (N6-isopentenyl adenosine(37)-C2)-methylthiotransferase MiaB [Candidatus Manganitrophaceae bacterium]|nr:MAG: tRNA (N6-isopentenyl adenosine(37)-C2)-methylthiotransferase MiaB [Candidatus Manganitrophaceae bacterium]
MKVYLETYGCQMNEYDSELIRSILAPHGHEITMAVEEAEVVLINTCAIRENAHRKIYGRLDMLRPLKKEKERFVVGVLGCMAQNLKEELFDHPVVNLIVGPDSYRSLPKLIDEVIGTDRQEIEAYLSEYETYSDIAPTRVEGVNAWVAIMRGCDNFCTFCVVPYTRGRERSRSIENILSEVRSLAEKGYRQVTLLGQNVNSYRDEGAGFADLILKAADVPGIERVRFTSPHPKDFPRPLLEAIASHPNICKHIHLPVQAGSDRILDLMARTYTRKEYLRLVEEIRRLIPGIALTTDLIVGFPTETEDDFQETAGLYKDCRFDSAYIFKYSERKGTIASRKYPDDVPPEVKTDRIVRLIDLQRAISLEKNRAKIGRALEVMIDGEAERRPGHQMGKTEGNTTVVFPRTAFGPGATVSVQIDDVSSNTLYGRPVER